MEQNNMFMNQPQKGELFDTRYGKKDRWFVLIAAALGFLFFELVFFEGFGISMTVWMVVFYAAVFWYLSGKSGGIDRRGLPLLVPIALLSACYGLYDNMLLAFLNFLLLIALVVLQLAAMTGNRLYKTFSMGLLIDLFHGAVALPLMNIPAPFRALKRRKDGGRKASPIWRIAIGLVISVPLLAVVLVLLAGADPVFERTLKDVFSYLNDNVLEYVGKVFLSLMAAIPLFGLLWALRHNQRVQALGRKINMDKARIIDEGIVNTVLVLLNIVYVVFIAIQFGYLFNAFSRILPDTFTYAEYARRGFLELMGVSVINLCVVSASMLFSRRNGRSTALLKALESALLVLTLLLVASAIAKMVMYMDAYGLTLLRVYVSWFLLLLAIVFIAMLVKLHLRKFALTRFCSVAFIVLFLGLNFTDVDARVAQYNIDCYRNGKFKTVDVEMFYNLSDSMIPYAAVLLDDQNPDIAAKMKELLQHRATIVDDHRWQVFSAARETARTTLVTNDIMYKQRSDRNMD